MRNKNYKLGTPGHAANLARRMARREEHRRRALELLGGCCRQCGAADRLEFDHIAPSTKCYEITTRLDCTWEHLLSELRKCQLLCRRCHETKSLREAGGPARHGTPHKYRHGCRCEDCAAAWKVYRQDYNKRNKRRLNEARNARRRRHNRSRGREDDAACPESR